MTRRKLPAPLAPLPAALGAVATIQPGNFDQPHLGNLAAVAGQLMRLLDRDHEHCVAFAAGLPWEKAHAKTEARIKALAAALLGQDPAFQHVPGWNEAGAIDAHLRTHLPSLDGSAEQVVTDALSRLVLLGRKMMEEPEADVIAEVLHGAVMKLARLLVGLRPQDSAEA
jgi:hypothetical protein